AGPPALVDEFDVVDTGGGVGDFQPLVMIDRMIAVVVGLIAAPLVLARRRKLQRSNSVSGQVPELGVLCRGAQWNEGKRVGYQGCRFGNSSLLPVHCGFAQRVTDHALNRAACQRK